jgi:pyruvate,water dikinase
MLDVVKATVAAKAVEVVPAPDGCGVVERAVEEERQCQPALAPDELKAVVALAKQAERHYGCPQDIEWALDAAVEPAAVVLLQSRPETVWSRAPRPAATTSYGTGLGSLVTTLINPLAGRRTNGVDADD